MKAVSVILLTDHAEDHLTDTLKSIIEQSFKDFELIISDKNSSDRTVEMIRSVDDPRIICLTGNNSSFEALNRALNIAQGNYIARVGTQDILCPERLDVQYALMEREPSVTVCGSMITPFVEAMRAPQPLQGQTGLIGYPLETLLTGNILFDTTVMFRRAFVADHGLRYEDFPGFEDYRLWCQMARLKGVFYIEPQSLQFHRMEFGITSYPKTDPQIYQHLQEDILNWLLSHYRTSYPILDNLYANLKHACGQHIYSESELLMFFSVMFDNINKRASAGGMLLNSVDDPLSED